jgi:hypothetical protein
MRASSSRRVSPPQRGVTAAYISGPCICRTSEQTLSTYLRSYYGPSTNLGPSVLNALRGPREVGTSHRPRGEKMGRCRRSSGSRDYLGRA